MSASVDGDGTVAVASGVTSAGNVKLSTGTYQIAFDRSLADCTCTASFGGRNGTFVATGLQMMISSNCPYTTIGPEFVRVVTYFNGALTDVPFQLMVFCPR